MKLILGERFKIINSNIKVSSKKIINSGFQFKFPKIIDIIKKYNMKTYSIIVVTLTLLFFFIYKYSSSKVTKTDENYIVLDKFNDIEIREYKNQLYVIYT